MKKTQIYILITVMSLALLGIIWLQVHHIQQGLMVYEKNFDMLVNNTLDRAARQLAQVPDQREWIKVARQVAVDPVEADPTLLNPNRPWARPKREEATSVLAQARVRIRDSVSYVSERETIISADSVSFGQARISYLFTSTLPQHPDSMPRQMVSSEMGGDQGLLPLLNTKGQNIPGTVYVPWMRVSIGFDSVFRKSLDQVGIEQPFEFQIQGLYNTVVADHEPDAYQVPIYDQAMDTKGTLSVSFPKKSILSDQDLLQEAGLSIGLVLVVMVCFWLSVRTIIRQKKLSEMKNDFINNMTHELKTPIATISLATDAIRNPKMQASPSGIERYTNIIKEENSRMHRQVERVLLAAQEQRGEVRLKKIPLDLHVLIHRAAEHTRLQVGERGGTLTLDLQATKFEVPVDKVHISNVLYNLLDNANKYSPDHPHITIRTYNQRGQFFLSVQDEGQGISKADQQRIFQRFYRVSTGDLHEVKGFGLGLSYVKAIVEAHGGHIAVYSTLGKGSSFEIALPLAGQVGA